MKNIGLENEKEILSIKGKIAKLRKKTHPITTLNVPENSSLSELLKKIRKDDHNLKLIEDLLNLESSLRKRIKQRPQEVKTLCERITKYMLRVNYYKFLTEEKFDKKRDGFLYKTLERYAAFSERAKGTLVEKKKREIWDRILCVIEPKFKSVVEFKPELGDKSELGESDKIPTVKEFINNYLNDNKIKIEEVSNKTVLEKEIYSAYKKAYPNNPRELTTFHRALPREA